MAILAHQRNGQGEPLVVMHGLFGSADNWRGLARRWSDEYGVWSLDLRNHGRSFHCEGMNYTSQAEDLLYWLDNENLERVHLLGHSMGGKLAMEFALRYPSRVAKLIVADIAPVRYEHTHAAIIQGLKALKAQEPWHERREADHLLAEYVKDVQTRLFLLTNLVRTDEGLCLRVAIEEIARDYQAIIDAPPAMTENRVFEGATLAIRGGRSDYVTEGHLPEFRRAFPQLQLETLDAGHWLHAEQADAFSEAVLRFLKQA
ncbi:alpha/beta fold hydrolase [Marinospirillum alkaliphilum]|uniref:Esterase n=1 Tax=Marinospirillum alkaliphilum DSM 21637 TaxID=1122209 RepID=A0A1K1UDS7_9GAMM|nr:alpha/beta fold hydrolase [Marinospirillum alkaliphilum]SFX10748.1 esterase [Marinospirillum alkaliphilum DSM 21637]